MQQQADHVEWPDNAADYAAFVLEAFGAADFEYDLRTRALRPSPRLNALYGYPDAHQLTAEECWERMHPDDRAMVAAIIPGALAGGAPRFQREFRIVLPGGATRWVLSRGEVLLDAEGRPSCVRGAAIDITERKQMETALRTIEGYQRAILNSVTQSIMLIAPDYRLLLFNHHAARAAEVVFGITMEVGQSILTYVAPEDHASFTAHFQQALAGREVRVERELAGIAGTDWWDFAYNPIVEPTGEVTGVTFTCQLISERKRAEAASREAQESLNIALEAAQMGTWDLDLRNDVSMRRSLRHDQIFGYTTAQAAWGQAIARRHVVEEDRERFDMAFARATRTGELNFDVRVRWPDASIHWMACRGRFFFDADGRLVRGAGVNFDITERKQLEALRAEAEAAAIRRSTQLQRLAQVATRIHTARDVASLLHIVTEEARALIGAHQAVTSTTTDQNWAQAVNAVSLSSKYAQWQGYSARPDGSGIYALVCRTNRPMRLTQAELEAHPLWQGFGAEAESHLPMRGWLAVPLVGLDGHNLGLIQLSDKEAGEFTADDEALLVQLAQMASVALENHNLLLQEQAARVQAEEAGRLKDEFLATVSHELRTPLTAFLGYAELLQRRKRDEAYITRTVEKMVQSARAQAQIVEDLLDIARIVSGRLVVDPEPIRLADVIRVALDTVRPSVEAKGLHITLDLDPKVGAVLGDANRLQQVVWNLLANAAKFTPPGGRITVRLAPAEHGVAMSVADTGQGIHPDFLPYVFDRFRQADSSSQRAHGGLGLGLAIVRHLVELHGGTVQASSAGIGQGATFTVRLPTAGAPTAASGARPGSAEAAGSRAEPLSLRGVRVLVVDDQPPLLDLLEELLVSEGATVRVCSAAREALHLVSAWRPDVLVSDIAMPDEDGYWLIQQVRSLSPEAGGEIPAVALTAYVRLEDRLRVLAAGFQQYVPKPVDAAELRAIVLRLARQGAEW